jgi:hypothetical protein
MRTRRRPEDAIQRAVFQHLRARGVAGLVAIHVGNGGYRRPIEARIMNGLGVTAGVPDVLAWHGSRAYALELKAEGDDAVEHAAGLYSRGEISVPEFDVLQRNLQRSAQPQAQAPEELLGRINNFIRQFQGGSGKAY